MGRDLISHYAEVKPAEVKQALIEKSRGALIWDSDLVPIVLDEMKKGYYRSAALLSELYSDHATLHDQDVGRQRPARSSKLAKGRNKQSM